MSLQKSEGSVTACRSLSHLAYPFTAYRASPKFIIEHDCPQPCCSPGMLKWLLFPLPGRGQMHCRNDGRADLEDSGAYGQLTASAERIPRSRDQVLESRRGLSARYILTHLTPTPVGPSLLLQWDLCWVRKGPFPPAPCTVARLGA